MKNLLIPSMIAFGLTACGGGGSSSSSNASGNNGNSNPPPAADSNIAKVAGLYETSRSDDEAYLYIAASGDVTAYDYQGDAKGSGQNCYIEATQGSQINSGLNGAEVTYASGSDTYTISGANTLEFAYSEDQGMSNFNLDGVITSDTGINIQSLNMNIVIGGSGRLQTNSPSIEDIKANLCS